MNFFISASLAFFVLSIYTAHYIVELHKTTKDSAERDFVSKTSLYVSIEEEEDVSYSPLQQDYYRDSCPSAERIIRKALKEIYKARPSIAPSLIRLLFHDCFIETSSEKEAPPNLSLKGLDVIAFIKSELENTCPGVVSCADTLALATKEAVSLAGGPKYSLRIGRKDSLVTFKDIAQRELPSPHATLSEILARFASRGFSPQETVSLLGAHSIGITHCTFFQDRLYNFSGTGKPDPELNTGFLQELKSKCPFSASASSPSPCPDTASAPSLPASDYHTNYGVMFSDQQLMASEETETWVRAYASDPLLFQRDFIKSMVKLSSYHVLTGPLGQVRTNCSKVLPLN
ncbi:BnaA03g51170D [Brassica napus]|uniref:Peroxidase n=1 Tax=Brassica napus TaxID=3708 RepID=A0A078FKA3_BRANA|nr:BnaA03g51170D [Brassica napus]